VHVHANKTIVMNETIENSIMFVFHFVLLYYICIANSSFWR